MKPQPDLVTADILLCPYGKPGARLWVREEFLGWYRTADQSFSHVAAYRADGYQLEPREKWMPAMCMPRSASRLTLEVVSVRVERAQDISEADARAEGIHEYSNGTFGLDDPTACMGMSAKVAYMRLWASIHGPASWDANPWVWCISFRGLYAS